MNEQSERRWRTPAERKKELIAESVRRRFAVSQARQKIQASLQMESLARTLLGKATQATMALAAGKSGLVKSASLRALLPLVPLVLRGAAALGRHAARKSVLRRAVIAVTLGGLAAMLVRKAITKRDARRSRRT